MSYTIIKKLPPMEAIIQEIPLHESGHERIAADRKEIRNILSGTDDRLLIIVGPCSAWPCEAVLEYAKRLLTLREKVKDKLKLVMRVYIQKPRTIKGWAGPVNQPHPLKEPDIEAGIRQVRKLMVEIINMGLPISDEALFTHNGKGFIELLSWAAIGARSTEDQEHRIYASSIDCPVGMKNPTHGSLSVAVNSIIAAQHPHVAVFEGHEVQTHGNAFAHLVLRGSNGQPNYDKNTLIKAHELIHQQGIKNPSLMIDVSHDNCVYQGTKDHARQSLIINDVLASIAGNAALTTFLKGFMIESFIKPGSQKVDPAHPENVDMGGLSITDPCLGWDETESLLLNLAERLRC